MTDEAPEPRPPGFAKILWKSIVTWLSSGAMHWGAALAYYALFSLGPLLLVLVGTTGLVLDAPVAGDRIVAQLRPFLGDRGAALALSILEAGSFPGFGSVQALVSIGLLLLAASAVFANVRGALNSIWSVQPENGGGLRRAVLRRLGTFPMLLVVGALVVASMALSAATTVLTPWLESTIPRGGLLAKGLEFVVSTVVLWLAFSATFRILPDADIAWRDVWAGALFTSLLFALGKILIGLYLRHSNLATVYGAAGSGLLVLAWFYYSAQIFVLGATFTAVRARARGRAIEPGFAPADEPT